ncbi:amidohydrolase family protein [Gordonia humi]|uniref:amidohydrolase family protein n=1 Tax=Gordonia humi TaxID=686429 RepID=UPI00360945BD
MRSATTVPAGVFGLTDRGQIRPGSRSDLVLVDGDPTTDIRDTRNIRAVWCAGVPQRLS